MFEDEPGPFGPLSRDDVLPLERGVSFETLVAFGVAELRGVEDTLLRVADTLVHASVGTFHAETAGDFWTLVGEVEHGGADGLEGLFGEILRQGAEYGGDTRAFLTELPPESPAR